MWHGISQSEMCATLTRVPSDVWHKQPDACKDLLDRDFVAGSIGVSIVGAALLIWKSLDICILKMMMK